MSLDEARLGGIDLLAVCAVALIAALWDLRTRRIPNWLTLPVLLAGLVWSGYSAGLQGLGNSLACAAFLALPCLLLFLFAGGGAGDVKLLGALGAWLNWTQAIHILLGVAAAGILCGLIMAVWRRRFGEVMGNVSRILATATTVAVSRRTSDAGILLPDRDQMQTMPFGVPIFLGVCLAVVGRWLWL